MSDKKKPLAHLNERVSALTSASTNFTQRASIFEILTDRSRISNVHMLPPDLSRLSSAYELLLTDAKLPQISTAFSLDAV